MLAPRIGTKAVVTAGLLLFGLSFLWISTVAVDASYATVIVPQMVMMGLGMGFISTPATESILLVLPPARAGVGSAVNDATRELGGTLGVAVVGSVFSSIYAAHLADGVWSQASPGVLEQAQDSVGAATAVAASQPQLAQALQDAFMTGLHTSSLMVGLLCLVAAAIGAVALPGRGTHVPTSRRPCPSRSPPDADRVVCRSQRHSAGQAHDPVRSGVQKGSRPIRPSSLVWASASSGTGTRSPYCPEAASMSAIGSMPSSISRAGVGVEPVVQAGTAGQVPGVHEHVRGVEGSIASGSGTSPVCRLLSTLSAVAGSSRSACTASLCTCHAATGSSSASGPRGSVMPAPFSRNDGNHSTRCRTTSRVDHSATGEGESQSVTATTRP